jgi:hypothetical protein
MAPVKMNELKALIERFQRKLEDLNDPDDKKWTARWLRRFRQEVTKKERGLETKQGDKLKSRPAPVLATTPVVSRG